jgi:Tfp pilus assembly protein PilV
MGSVSMTTAPDTTAAPASPPTARRGFGNLPSMVISMVFIMAAVLAWVAMVPRVREINQPAVDVTSVAMQVRQETGWAISQPQLPAAWKATNARFDSAADGVRTWHAGYLSPDGHYVSIDQTEVTGATEDWTSERTSNGQADGTLSAAGRTWHKLSSRDILQRSLVSKGSAAHDLTTVLSGTAPYAQLAQFADTLKAVPAS